MQPRNEQIEEMEEENDKGKITKQNYFRIKLIEEWDRFRGKSEIHFLEIDRKLTFCRIGKLNCAELANKS